MSGIPCPSCQDWTAHPRDRFCGGCGASFIRLQPVLESAFHFADQEGNPKVLVALTNRSHVPVGGGELVVRAEGGTELFRTSVPEDALALPGDRWQCQFDGPPRGPALAAELLFRPGGAARDISLANLGFSMPNPVPGLARDVVSLPIDGVDAGPVHLTLHIRLLQGLMAPLQRILVQAPGIQDMTWSRADSDSADTILRRGGEVAVAVAAGRDLVDRLLAQPSGLEMTAKVTIAGRDPASLGFRLVLSSPPRPKLVVQNRLFALPGRDLRVPVTVLNLGGDVLQVQSVQMEVDGLKGGKQASVVSAPAAACPHPVPPGGSLSLMLRLGPVADQPVTLRGTVRARFGGGDLAPAAVPVEVEVRTPRPFAGSIAIDFGTTETAVSVRHPGGDGLPVLLALEDRSPYVPTVIGYSLGGGGTLVCRIGHEVEEMVPDRGEAQVQVHDQLKWTLSKGGRVVLPDNSLRWRLELAADYLRILKMRIEEHAAIGARVDQAYVTVPSRFDARDLVAIQEAFRIAGIEPLGLELGGRDILPLESWSPASLTLPVGRLRELAVQAFSAAPISLEQARGKGVALVTFDVGGGSTDLSAFQIRIMELDAIDIAEVHTDSSREVCGNRISDLLTRHLSVSLRAALARRGLSEADVPMQLPWQSGQAGDPDRLALANGRSLAALIRQIQQAEQFSPVGLDLLNLSAKESMATAERLETQILPSLTSLPDLVLTDRTGKVHRLPWSGGELRLQVGAFLRDFADGPAAAARTMIQQAAEALARVDGVTVRRLMVSGRGSAFRLLADTIDRQLKELGSDWTALRMQFDLLKPITSVGALVLADLLPMNEDMRFSTTVATWFGFAGPIDRATGDNLFIPICQGLPDDRPRVCRFPVGGPRKRIPLRFGMADRREGSLRAVGFRTDFECNAVIKPLAADMALWVRVDPDGPSRFKVGLVAAADEEGALATADWCFADTISLFPDGYEPRASVEAAR